VTGCECDPVAGARFTAGGWLSTSSASPPTIRGADPTTPHPLTAPQQALHRNRCTRQSVTVVHAPPSTPMPGRPAGRNSLAVPTRPGRTPVCCRSTARLGPPASSSGGEPLPVQLGAGGDRSAAATGTARCGICTRRARRVLRWSGSTVMAARLPDNLRYASSVSPCRPVAQPGGPAASRHDWHRPALVCLRTRHASPFHACERSSVHKAIKAVRAQHFRARLPGSCSLAYLEGMLKVNVLKGGLVFADPS
jgi:hypothetical protein